jgi:hypothetical protein
MRLDDRFDDLVVSLGGFYRTWYVYAGLELGLLAELRAAGGAGLTADDLARRTGTSPPYPAVGLGREHDLVRSRASGSPRSRTSPPSCSTPTGEYLGGQYLYAAIGSMDFGELADVFRTGRPMGSRPDRYRSAIERLTVQDVGVFFTEVLAALPQLIVDLRPGSRILDVHARPVAIAMARRFPERLTGVEFEPDSIARARQNIDAVGLADRIRSSMAT